ncbi:putative chromophore lyase CpcT/CpeT [Helianthus annuus]|nr:putative chromophore lyase CpcT/CpeT [Helianthus annuus]
MGVVPSPSRSVPHVAHRPSWGRRVAAGLSKTFWRTPHKPFRQRFCTVKPCPKEMKCDVELSTYAIRDAEEYKNSCDRSRDQRPLPEEVSG